MTLLRSALEAAGVPCTQELLITLDYYIRHRLRTKPTSSSSSSSGSSASPPPDVTAAYLRTLSFPQTLTASVTALLSLSLTPHDISHLLTSLPSLFFTPASKISSRGSSLVRTLKHKMRLRSYDVRRLLRSHPSLLTSPLPPLGMYARLGVTPSNMRSRKDLLPLYLLTPAPDVLNAVLWLTSTGRVGWDDVGKVVRGRHFWDLVEGVRGGSKGPDGVVRVLRERR